MCIYRKLIEFWANTIDNIFGIQKFNHSKEEFKLNYFLKTEISIGKLWQFE